MRPKRTTGRATTVTESDKSLMDIVHRAFDSTGKMKTGLPSVIGDIKSQLNGLLTRRVAAPNLHELFETQGTRPAYSMQSMLTAMVFAAIKQARTTRGSKEPVFLEEVDLMLEKEIPLVIPTLMRCMGEIA